jgi:lipopolysaccharide export LptBFGC system permease protein LptF
MISKGDLDPRIGLWAIHGAFLFIALVLFYRRARNLPLVPLPRLRWRRS